MIINHHAVNELVFSLLIHFSFCLPLLNIFLKEQQKKCGGDIVRPRLRGHF